MSDIARSASASTSKPTGDPAGRSRPGLASRLGAFAATLSPAADQQIKMLTTKLAAAAETIMRLELRVAGRIFGTHSSTHAVTAE